MDIAIIIGLALLLTLIFVYGLGSRGPWGSGWTIFFVLLFAIWATAIWVEPIGPVYYNVAWLPIVIVGLVFFILLLSVTPREPKVITPEEERREAAAAGGVMLFFWIFLVVMAAIVAIGYIV